MLAKQLQGAALATIPQYIEDVFSTYLYTGNGSTQTITNGVDLAGKGGLVWIKSRSAATNNFLFDTVRGTTDELNTNTTDAEASLANSLTAFNSDGFSIGSATGIGVNAATYVSWTFRKQAKFFDVVTYTGNSTNRTISHSLGVAPGMIVVKNLSSGSWYVYHRSLTAANSILLNNTIAAYADSLNWNNTEPTSTVFSVGTSVTTNGSGNDYVAYLFAHDAGGFGASGTDNVISCGSYTGDGAATKNITINYEPQWVLVKNASAATNWLVIDQMRGMPAGTDNSALLNPNLSNAESSNNRVNTLSATGFLVQGAAAETNASGNTYIYIAIRRGPMRTPTSGTSVFSPVTYSGGTAQSQNLGFNGDLLFIKKRSPTASDRSIFIDRLRGFVLLSATNTGAELTPGDFGLTNASFPSYTGSNKSNFSSIPTGDNGWNSSGSNYVDYGIARAPGFFDVVCYTGNGSTQNISHNLGVVPEMMIVKSRSTARDWAVYLGNNGRAAALNTTAGDRGFAGWNYTSPTSSQFSLGTDSDVNASSTTYVAYLFATVAGVSKVGSYTGTGTTQVINCGFTAGSRFVMIKRTDSTGDWYVWDSARGIVAGNDPYLLLNSTAAEVTNTDYVDTSNAGFEISSTAPAAINANGGSFIFFAVA